jgi:hypothetical protein
MVRAGLAVTVALLLSTRATRADQPPQQDQPKTQQPAITIEEDPDAYEIYSVLLWTELPASWKVGAWPIRQETERGSLPMCLVLPADQTSVYRPVIEDFERRNQRRVILQRKFDLPAYTLVNPADKTPSQNPRLPFVVSAVGFNKDHNLASCMSPTTAAGCAARHLPFHGEEGREMDARSRLPRRTGLRVGGSHRGGLSGPRGSEGPRPR